MPGTQIVAHRGASAAAPENTVAAVSLAWEMNADAIEIDLRLTKDKKVVAIHDATTRRTTGCDHTVAGLTLGEIQQLDAGAFKGIRWRGERIPSLRDVLETVPAGKRVVLELKDGMELLRPLQQDLEGAGLSAQQIDVIAFDHDLAGEVKKRLPQIKVLWLYGDFQHVRQDEWPTLKKSLIQRTLDAGLDGLDLGIKHPAIDIAFFQQIKQAGLQVYVWTVNDLGIGERLLRSGALDAITTDVPDQFLRLKAEIER